MTKREVQMSEPAEVAALVEQLRVCGADYWHGDQSDRNNSALIHRAADALLREKARADGARAVLEKLDTLLDFSEPFVQGENWMPDDVSALNAACEDAYAALSQSAKGAK